MLRLLARSATGQRLSTYTTVITGPRREGEQDGPDELHVVVLDNGGNLATAYAHQSEIAVSCGQHVEQGQVIGYVGCTGHCFGPHLHFEVRINGTPVDPLGYL